ncbi:MAG: preprotein translocase subunit SecG [Pseudomonadales bacterium]|nr:preprotein translocase subunit SecG [Pseudomonadales bacterium]
MQTLETVLLVLLVLDSIALVAIVLVQQGKGSDVGAAFGSGGANTVFGSSATSFLTKLTAGLAASFFLIAFGLAYTASERAASLRGFDFNEGELPAIDAGDLPAGEEAPVEGDDLPELIEDAGRDSGEGGAMPDPGDSEEEGDGLPNL